MKFENKIPAVITIGGKDVNKIKIGGEVVWQKEVEPVDVDYFYVENASNGNNNIYVKTAAYNPKNYATSIQYSKDKTNWTTIPLNFKDSGSNIGKNFILNLNLSINEGEKIYFRNDSGYFNYSNDNYYFQNIFDSDSEIRVGGNPKSLLNYTDIDGTSLKRGCFYGMFYNSKKLTDASKLNLSDTSLVSNCYQDLFYGCSSLNQAPELAAEILQPYCYKRLFAYCPLLTEITVYANDISASNCTNNWLSNVASTGTFNNYGSATYKTNSSSGIPSGWTEVKPIEPDYLYIENVDESDCELSSTTYTSKTLPPPDKYTNKVEFSTDKETWTTWNFDTANTLTIPIGGKVYLRNNSGVFNYYGTDGYYYVTSIKTTMKCNVGGNLNTLLNYNEEILDISDKRSCFRRLFIGAKIVDASKLVMPATTLSQYCYAEFFSGNSSLIAPPELPAVNLADSCYYKFFYECSSLTASPSLPATTLAKGCYESMYERCYKLTTGPILPASTLVPNSYKWMFNSCWKLSSVTIYANTNADNALYNWLNGVPSSGTLYNYGVLPLPQKTPSGVPNGWKEEFPPIESVTANPNTFTMKSFENSVECTSTLTITTTGGITSTVSNSTTVVVGENTGDTTRTLPHTLYYRGIPYEVTIIQTANDPTE